MYIIEENLHGFKKKCVKTNLLILSFNKLSELPTRMQ